jgi:predicted thioesterase
MKALNDLKITQHRYTVKPADVAAFNHETVHAVCSTFVLAREVEWTTRQFVLALRDDDEEGIGTHLSIDHKNPAFVGEEIIFTAQIEELNGHELVCTFQAHANGRLIATGKTGQKILKKEKIERILKKP